jgi:hypothetical protein
MKIPRLIQTACMATLLAATAVPAQETDNARLPYGVVYEQMKAIQQMAGLDKLHFSTTITSRNEAVGAADIQITLDDGQELHVFPLGPNGETNIPSRDDWVGGEMLFLETNQPRGSLLFNAHYQVKPLPGETLDYAYLADITDQLQQAVQTQPGVPGEAPDVLEGLEFGYAAGETASLSVRAAGGEQVLTTDDDGSIFLVIDPALAAENPTVVFSALPELILPMVKP